jgi:hypothetical protein
MTMWRSSSVRAFLLPLVVGAAAACSTRQAREPDSTAAAGAAAPADSLNNLTAQERPDGWRLLFDGKSLAGWRGYRRQDVPAGWSVVDGAITRVGQGGDLVTTDTFASFDLSLQWKVAPAGNSGVMFHVVEGPEQTYMSGPEMQVLDDARHPDGKSRLTSAGAAYGLYPAPEGAVRPADQWNTARLRVDGNHVEQWLNGTKTADYEIGSPDWEKRVKESKFSAWPTYGRARAGRIALQDHGDRVAFRNIKIRVLP